VTVSAKEASVLVSYAKRKLRRPQEKLRMNVDEILLRYAKLHLFHLQTIDALTAAQKRNQELEKELEALRPKPEAPQAT